MRHSAMVEAGVLALGAVMLVAWGVGFLVTKDQPAATEEASLQPRTAQQWLDAARATVDGIPVPETDQAQGVYRTRMWQFGLAYAEQLSFAGRTEEAICACRQLVQADLDLVLSFAYTPDDRLLASNYMGCTRYFIDVGDMEVADAMLATAMELSLHLDREDADNYLHWNRLSNYTHDIGTVEACRRLREMEGDDPDEEHRLSTDAICRILFEQGRTDEIMAEISVYEGDARGWFLRNLVEMHIDADQLAEAQQVAESIEHDYFGRFARLAVATARIEDGDVPDDVDELLDDAIVTAPELESEYHQQGLWWAIARCQAALGREADARANADRAWEMVDQYDTIPAISVVYLRLSIGEIYKPFDDPEAVVTQLRQIDPEINYETIASAFVRANWPEGAIWYFEDIERQPSANWLHAEVKNLISIDENYEGAVALLLCREAGDRYEALGELMTACIDADQHAVLESLIMSEAIDADEVHYVSMCLIADALLRGDAARAERWEREFTRQPTIEEWLFWAHRAVRGGLTENASECLAAVEEQWTEAQQADQLDRWDYFNRACFHVLLDQEDALAAWLAEIDDPWERAYVQLGAARGVIWREQGYRDYE